LRIRLGFLKAIRANRVPDSSARQAEVSRGVTAPGELRDQDPPATVTGGVRLNSQNAIAFGNGRHGPRPGGLSSDDVTHVDSVPDLEYDCRTGSAYGLFGSVP
jgi:hypothetical protein